MTYSQVIAHSFVANPLDNSKWCDLSGEMLIKNIISLICE